MPDHLPTPFTAAEIRAACRAGRTLRFRHKRAGEPTVIRVSQYVSVDADGCVQESWQESPDGKRLSESQREHSTWLELQEHASFPAATTVCAEEELDLPMGRFGCLRYTRADANATWRFWFARDFPGQPVRFEQQVGESLVFSAVLIENVSAHYDPPAPASDRKSV